MPWRASRGGGGRAALCAEVAVPRQCAEGGRHSRRGRRPPGSETRTRTIPGSRGALQAHHTSQQLSHDFKCGLNNELHLPVIDHWPPSRHLSPADSCHAHPAVCRLSDITDQKGTLPLLTHVHLLCSHHRTRERPLDSCFQPIPPSSSIFVTK